MLRKPEWWYDYYTHLQCRLSHANLTLISELQEGNALKLIDFQ